MEARAPRQTPPIEPLKNAQLALWVHEHKLVLSLGLPGMWPPVVNLDPINSKSPVAEVYTSDGQRGSNYTLFPDPATKSFQADEDCEADIFPSEMAICSTPTLALEGGGYIPPTAVCYYNFGGVAEV